MTRNFAYNRYTDEGFPVEQPDPNRTPGCSGDRAVKIFKLLSHPKRYEIVQYLCKEALTVSELMVKTHLEQAVVSQLLAQMRAANIVEGRRQARTMIYALKDPVCRQLLTLVSSDSPDR